MRSGALLGDEIGRGQLTDEAADGTAGEAGPGHELGARGRTAAMELPDDRAQVRPADGLAALAGDVQPRDHGFVFLSLKCCDTLVHESIPCQEMSGADHDRPAL